MDNQALASFVQEALEAADIEKALAAVSDTPAVDIADVISQLPSVLAWDLLERVKKRATVFAYLDTDKQVQFAHEFPRTKFAKLLGEMPADNRTDLFKQLDKSQRNALLPALAHAEREDIRKLSAYEEGTAGAMMTSAYATLEQGMSATDALEVLRASAPDAETIYHAYVIDKQRRLKGLVSLRALITASPDSVVDDFMVKSFVSSEVSDSSKDVANQIARYDLIAIPVTNASGKIVGIVTHDDATDVFSEEATSDFHKSGGVVTTVGNLKSAGIGLLYRKRVFWLVLLVFGNLFSGAGIAHFEDIIAANLVLVFFLPLLVDSGGNAGSQSATLMVRALATGEVEMRDWLYLVGREALVALLLGATMAVAVSAVGLYRGDSSVAMVLAMSMVTIVLVGSLIGMSLPFLLSHFRLDAASASAPLITSICDVSGVLIYLFIASKMLNGLGL